MQQILTYFFLVVYSVTILGIILVIITENRNPLKTLPWIVVLVLAPVVGLVFYFFFGQNLSKQRIISRRTRKRITMQLEEPEHTEGPGIPPRYRPLASLLLNTLHSVPLYGSRIAVYTDGKSKMEALMEEIARARQRIWIQTPYYLPSDVLNTALHEAALAGIDVHLMLPARSDSKVVDLATHSYLDDMMKAGVKISFYTPGFLHSKLLIIDDMLSVIGSANMDFRSFEHNFEINAFVYDREFASRMAAIFEDDLAHCHTVTPGEWFTRPRTRRVAESLMRVFSPLL